MIIILSPRQAGKHTFWRKFWAKEFGIVPDTDATIYACVQEQILGERASAEEKQGGS